MAINIIEIGLAFLEGLALIASPCILPVLPLVLGTTIDGGKSRPYGIIFGFIISFSLFALGSSLLLRKLPIDLDILKHLSLILLTLIGLTLLFNPLYVYFERLLQPLADKGNFKVNSKGGFLSGIFIGGLIGLVWTPCAGPILAAALVQIIRQENSINSLFLVVSFSLGVAIPMLLVAMIGRDFMAKTAFVQKHAGRFRQCLGILILCSVVYYMGGLDLALLTKKDDKALIAPKTELVNPLGVPYPAPEFSDIQAWLNSEPLTMKGLKGKVVLIDFWTYSCINCIRTLPYLTAWDNKYRDAGLVIVGVHSPEFEFEKKTDNIKAATEKFHIRYPVAIDNKLSTWQAFHNLYWPAHYLIDKEGRVVYTHFGEGAYEITEHNIAALLDKQDAHVSEGGKTGSYISQTPETYLGYFRFDNFANKQQFQNDIVKDYRFTSDLALHQWSLNGAWRIEGEKTVCSGNHCGMRLHFKAKKVFLVMGSDSDPIRVKLLLNGRTLSAEAGSDVNGSTIDVKQHRLYELISLPQNEEGLLELEVESPGLEIYAFTFG